MKHRTILKEIAVMSASDLNGLVDAIKMRRTALARDAVATFAVGDRVSFVGKGGTTVFGTIEKCAIKNLTVQTEGAGRWKVPGTMLTMA
jgi:tRNA(Ile2) C34 agmatinyltransferase TiaS